MKPVLTVTALVIATFAVAVPAASAQVQPAGSGEPLYTKSTQNTQWITWQAPGGVDGYRHRYSWYRDGVLVTEATYDVALSGTSWVDWAGIATLEEGKTYAICVQGSYSFPNDSLYFPDGPSSCSMGTQLGKRTHTTIDRTAPTISVALDNGAATSGDASVGLRIDFQDATAGPF